MITRLSKTRFKVNLGFLSIQTDWEIDETQKLAAWELYVELSTRITTIMLKPDEGFLREALTSFYSLFDTTREVLKRHGPEIAAPANPNDTTLGHISVGMLNKVIRPLLAKWHPLLADWEARKPAGNSVVAHEKDWPLNDNLRKEIEELWPKLRAYAEVLAEVSGVAKLNE